MKKLKSKLDAIYGGHGRKFDTGERALVGRYYKSCDRRMPQPGEKTKCHEALQYAAGRCEGLDAYRRVTGDGLPSGSVTMDTAGGSGVAVESGEVGSGAVPLGEPDAGPAVEFKTRF